MHSSGCTLAKCILCFPLFQSHLFSKVNIPASGILTIDSSLPVADCAEDYERKLKEVLHCLIDSCTKKKITSQFFTSTLIEEWIMSACTHMSM